MLLQMGLHPDTITHSGLWIVWAECEANLSRWERVNNSLNLTAVGGGHLIEQEQAARTVHLF